MPPGPASVAEKLVLAMVEQEAVPFQTSPDRVQLLGFEGESVGFPVASPWLLVTEILQTSVLPCRFAERTQTGLGTAGTLAVQAEPVPSGPERVAEKFV